MKKKTTRNWLLLVSILVTTMLQAQTVNGGDGSGWNVSDNLITDNGLPQGGNCINSVAGSGATLIDANLPGNSDAYDGGALFWIDSNQVGGLVTIVGQTATFTTSTISGLSVTLQYYFDPNSATQRSYLLMTNPTASAITVQVDYAGNFGSDGGTVVNGSSSGDTTFSTADYWLVTSDGGPIDPANTTVIGGSGAPVSPSISVSQTVFNCAGTEGTLATYSVTIPANDSRSILTFQQLDTSIANAITEAADFDSYPLPADFTAGLTPAQLADVVNFDFPTSVVYVNDNFTDPNGTAIADADPNTPGAQSATIGIDAFDTIQEGVDAVIDGGDVFITDDVVTDGPAVYSENVVVSKNVNITGTESDFTAVNVDGGAAGSVFVINPGPFTVNMNNITIQNGLATDGGGILSTDAILTITGCLIRNNVANGASGSGGGIFSGGTLTVSSSNIDGNDANRAGGGIEIATGSGLTTLTNVALSNRVL